MSTAEQEVGFCNVEAESRGRETLETVCNFGALGVCNFKV